MPGAANALFARVIEDLGFEAVYVSGAGIANMQLGVPDIGLTTLTEIVDTVAPSPMSCRCPCWSMPTRASAMRSTWCAPCACSSARARPASRSRIRYFPRSAATFPARP